MVIGMSTECESKDKPKEGKKVCSMAKRTAGRGEKCQTDWPLPLSQKVDSRPIKWLQALRE